MASKVYFTDFRTYGKESLPHKLQRLIRAAGIGDIEMNKQFVAIKIHFGEPGNLSYLRPQYARAVAEVVKEQGGLPFLTDCNTLYRGKRKNALNHLEAAAENGFNPATTGCQILIADGLKGTDEVLIDLPDGEYVKQAKVGRALMDADILISLNHFKGHEATGVGGALKNIGMGGGSRAGKMEQHNSGKPQVNQKKCVGCHGCERACGQDAVAFGPDGKARILEDKCVGCGRCLGACNFDAVYNANGHANEILDYKIAEYAAAICRGRPHFHISLIVDVSPQCDCRAENDAPILPNIGMLASFDPVALDEACADLCNAQQPLPGTILWDAMARPDFTDHRDHFTNTAPVTDWHFTQIHAEKLGLGSREYELIRLK